MAGSPRLIAGLTGLVLLAHGLLLHWLASQWQAPPQLQALATPMLTRQLLPAAASTPPAPPAAARAAPTAPSAPKNQPNVPFVQSGRDVTAMDSVADSTPTLAAQPTASTTISATPATPTATTTPTATVADSTAAPPAAPASAPAAAPAGPQPDSWPADTRLRYRLGGQYRGELHGSAQVQWLRDPKAPQRYETRIDMEIGWMVRLTMLSQGELSDAGLLPRAYEESLAGRRRTVQLAADQVTLNDQQRQPRPPGVQDTASQFVELSHRFASGRARLAVGEVLTLWLARPGGMDLWTYDVSEKVTLDTPQLGPVEAFHLKPRPLPNPRGPITAEIWFAPALQYLPVRIRISLGDNAQVDLLVERIEQR